MQATLTCTAPSEITHHDSDKNNVNYQFSGMCERAPYAIFHPRSGEVGALSAL